MEMQDLPFLYGFYHTEHNEDVDYIRRIRHGQMSIGHTGSTRADWLILQLGLRWDTWTDDERFHFRIQAGWEHHIYFSQNQFPRFVNDEALGTSLPTKATSPFKAGHCQLV